MNPLLTLTDVIRSYDGFSAGPFSLSLAPRTITAIVGPNGSGKTTLLRLAAGLILPTRGKAEIPLLLKSLVLEKRHLYPLLTVDENLDLFMSLSRRVIEGKDKEKLLERFNLVRHRATRVEKLSRGEKQRASLAKVFLLRSPLMFLDEPFSGLDLAAQELLVDELRQAAAEGAAVLVASHRVSFLSACAHELIALHGGKVTYQGVWNDEVVK